MNRPVRSVNRHYPIDLMFSSPKNQRLGALILVFIALNQLEDPMIDASIGQELLYWSVRISVLVIGLWMADRLVSSAFANRWTHPLWLKPVLLVSAIGLLPFAVAETLIEPHLPIKPEFNDEDLWNLSPILAFLSEYATNISIYLPVHMLLWLVIEPRTQPHKPNKQHDRMPLLPKFLEQSGVERVEDVYALQAEEHYVRIHTQKGAELIHCRFGDAVSKMPIELGTQVHRSWWVAERAIQSANREARRWQLNLRSQISVPVSDSYVKGVREKGWLKKKDNGGSAASLS